MLAYVFWHWRRDDVAPAVYEELQNAFHRTLAAAPPPGCAGSRSFALRGLPWAASGADAYEDWYLLEASAGLDALNEAAVTGPRQGPHDAAAAAAGGGGAGLYDLRLGADLPEARHAYWFAKPAGRRYAEVFEALAPLAAEGRGALWCRRMVLGPSPEFCLQTVAPVMPPGVADPIHVTLRPAVPPPA